MATTCGYRLKTSDELTALRHGVFKCRFDFDGVFR